MELKLRNNECVKVFEKLCAKKTKACVRMKLKWKTQVWLKLGFKTKNSWENSRSQWKCWKGRSV